MAETVTRMPPVGYYLAREVGRLAGVSGDRIGQWARRGYIRASRGEGPPNAYSYQDVAEAMAVHELTIRGAKLQMIRRFLDELREVYGDWPLTTAPIGWDRATARPVLVQSDTPFSPNREQGMQGFGLSDLERIAVDLRRGGWAVRQVEDIAHIEVDPNRLSGQPTIKGRRIEAEMVAQIARSSEGRRRLRDEYDLSEAEIDDAVRWCAAVASFEAA